MGTGIFDAECTGLRGCGALSAAGISLGMIGGGSWTAGTVFLSSLPSFFFSSLPSFFFSSLPSFFFSSLFSFFFSFLSSFFFAFLSSFFFSSLSFSFLLVRSSLFFESLSRLDFFPRSFPLSRLVLLSSSLFLFPSSFFLSSSRFFVSSCLLLCRLSSLVFFGFDVSLLSPMIFCSSFTPDDLLVPSFFFCRLSSPLLRRVCSFFLLLSLDFLFLGMSLILLNPLSSAFRVIAVASFLIRSSRESICFCRANSMLLCSGC